MFDKWQSDIPSVSKGLAIVLLLLNIFIPALGTFLCACSGGSFKPSQILVGFLQLITIFILVGYIWSIWWGIVIMNKSRG